MDKALLNNTAKELVESYKGILAADESTPTIKKRFDKIGVESTEETRRFYRNLLFATDGIEEFISGVILYDETIRQSSLDGTPFPKLLADKGIIPGIKVDQGTEELPGHPNEKVTKGLDGLSERLHEYKEMGARFAKWRAVIKIGEGMPSEECLNANMDILAQYAFACQEADIVPIVEPEVLMDGAHELKACEEATYRTLKTLFTQLSAHNVALEGTLLKINMILPGKDSEQKVNDHDISGATFRIFNEVVPDVIPGIVFLSGGQSADDATRRLNEISQWPQKPWELSFSFGRALQEDALKAWQGKEENLKAAQQAFYERAEKISRAREGEL